MMKTSRMVCAGAALMVALLAVHATAGIITHPLGIPPGPAPVASGPGLGLVTVPLVSTPTPNNDNVPAAGVPDNNIDVNLKRFDFNDYIDIEFSVLPSGGVTEYRVVEFVDNNTGLPWLGYRVQLGTGVGPNFQLVNPASGLDFDAPQFDTPPTSTAMAISTLSPNELVYSGFHGAGAQQYEFRIDVPDLALVGNLGQFTLRQIPVPIPEPASLVLVALASLALVGRRR